MPQLIQYNFVAASWILAKRPKPSVGRSRLGGVRDERFVILGVFERPKIRIYRRYCDWLFFSLDIEGSAMSEREEYYAGFDPGRETEIEEAESDVFDVEVEREQIREINERSKLPVNARYRQLAKLREEIEQYRAAYERAKKASGQ